MPSPSLIDHAYDDLAHSLRVLLDADYHANRGGLLLTDRAEAVGNIETALGAVLNALGETDQAISAYRRAIRIAYHDPIEIADLAIDGDDLLKAGITGPAVGVTLRKLLDTVSIPSNKRQPSPLRAAISIWPPRMKR